MKRFQTFAFNSKLQPYNEGVAKCPFTFYDTWVNNPELAQKQVEALTREHAGVECCPVAGVPLPSQAGGCTLSSSPGSLKCPSPILE